MPLGTEPGAEAPAGPPGAARSTRDAWGGIVASFIDLVRRCRAAAERARAARNDERGITGLETAIILIAFVVVAAVFAFVVLSTGLFSSERGKEAVYAGLAKTRGTMELS